MFYPLRPLKLRLQNKIQKGVLSMHLSILLLQEKWPFFNEDTYFQRNGVPFVDVYQRLDDRYTLLFVRYLDSTEYIERFKKYEADYTCRLMAKYFSKKNLYGGKQCLL